MTEQKNLIAIAIKNWLLDPQNPKRWAAKEKELEKLTDILNRLKEYPSSYIPLRLACSVYLTQGSNNRLITFPKTLEDFLSIWNDIRPKTNETNEQLSIRFTIWLKSKGNHLRAGKFGNYYARYFTRFNPVEDLQKLKSLGYQV
jgi:hypothetical protein